MWSQISENKLYLRFKKNFTRNVFLAAIPVLVLAATTMYLFQGNAFKILLLLLAQTMVTILVMGWKRYTAKIFPNLMLSLNIVGIESCLTETAMYKNRLVADLVAEIRRQFSERDSEMNVTVIFAGKVLEELKSLESCGVISGSHLVVLLHEDHVEQAVEEIVEEIVEHKEVEEVQEEPILEWRDENLGEEYSTDEESIPDPNLFPNDTSSDDDSEISTEESSAPGAPAGLFLADDSDSDSDSESSESDDSDSSMSIRISAHSRRLSYGQGLFGAPSSEDESDSSDVRRATIGFSSGDESDDEEGVDMITLEVEAELIDMGCSKDPSKRHLISKESLLNYIQHGIRSRESEISCPKCREVWDYPFLRSILTGYEGFTEEVRSQIERGLSGNLISQHMNAKRCCSCSTLLRRKHDNRNFCATCVGCEEGKFCWACSSPWEHEAIACSNGECPSWIREVTSTLLQKCPTKHIDHMRDVPVLRACPNCGQMITHISDCKHMDCAICHRSFCFVCLSQADEYGNYECGYNAETCPLAERQQKEQLVATGLRNYSDVLDASSASIRTISEDCEDTKHGVKIGSQEFYDAFADEMLANLKAAGWNGYDSDSE